MGEDRLAVLSAARPWALSDEALVAGVDALHALAVEVDAALVRFVRELDARRAASRYGASSVAVWLRNRHLVSIRSAHKLVRLAKRIDAAPSVVGDGVADGRVNLDQAEVVVRAVARIPAEVGVDIREQAAAKLVELCAEYDPELLRTIGDHILSLVAPEVAEELDRRAVERAEARAHHERYFTVVPDGVGVRLSGRLTAEGAAIVRAAIDPLAKPLSHDERTPEQRRADALVAVCMGDARPRVVVSTQFDVLQQELTGGTVDNGDRVTPDTVRRLACYADLIPVVLNTFSVPLDLGRAHRLVSGPLRTALEARDRGCCFPGCDRPSRWTQAHHVVHWSLGGPTCLDNLLLLCAFHHGEVHKPDGWTVFMAPDGLPTFLPPKHIDPLRRPQRNQYHRRQ
jgi:hypothetical protein